MGLFTRNNKKRAEDDLEASDDWLMGLVDEHDPSATATAAEPSTLEHALGSDNDWSEPTESWNFPDVEVPADPPPPVDSPSAFELPPEHQLSPFDPPPSSLHPTDDHGFDDHGFDDGFDLPPLSMIDAAGVDVGAPSFDGLELDGPVPVPAGVEIDDLLDALGAHAGTDWAGISAAHRDAIAECDPNRADDEEQQELARQLRYEMNTTYARLRLMATSPAA